MSFYPGTEPTCDEKRSATHIDAIIGGRARDIGAFSVRRVLPARTRRLVGPFVFFDHMGPARLAPGHGVDVRPHPHINCVSGRKRPPRCGPSVPTGPPLASLARFRAGDSLSTVTCSK